MQNSTFCHSLWVNTNSKCRLYIS